MGTANLADKPAPVRPGEELDTEKLQAYLHAHFPDMADSTLEVLQFPSGHSNLTYLLQLGERQLVLRRPPFGARIKTAHDMQREHHILSALYPVYSRVPRPLLYCDDDSILGAPFYIMERLPGLILRSTLPTGLELPAERMRALSENFVDNLVQIHQLDYQAAGLGDLGHPEGYVRRQIEGWTKRYFNARTDDIPQIERTAAWLGEHMPPDSGAAIIHNDYKYDNLVLDPDNPARIIGVLDWEMATLGDPLMDLGTSLGYWVDPGDPPEMQAIAFCLTTLPGNLSRRELAERYAQKRNLDLKDVHFYYVYGLFKIAVIVQQIYARYKAGYSQDARFANLNLAVGVLGKVALQAIEKGRLDDL
ncbi:MAG TPA: phosphotransferase family protein [Anaerolineales bacterium]|nr:phosphotransferase family protein [Anaerolineales bacterium]